MADLDGLKSTLEKIREMDYLFVLEAHLLRAESLLEEVAGRPGGREASTLLQLKTRLDNYYYFLMGAGTNLESLRAGFWSVRDLYPTARRVTEAANSIESDLRESCGALRTHVEGLEGSALLSWTHAIRYYVGRAWVRLQDLRHWTSALERFPDQQRAAEDLCGRLSTGWPVQKAHAQALLSRLEEHLAGAWAHGRGRKAKKASEGLAECLSDLSRVGDEVSRLKARADRALGHLQGAAATPPDPRVSRITREVAALSRIPAPRLRGAVEEVEDVVRALEVRTLQRQISKSIGLEMHHVAGRGSEKRWADVLEEKHARVAAAHKFADPILKIILSASALGLGLKNEEQREELRLRKASLAAAIVGSEFSPGEAVTRSLSRYDWLAARLTPHPHSNGFCTRFGELILSGDSLVQCPDCSTFCHADCLIGGRCPVDGYQIFVAEPQ